MSNYDYQLVPQHEEELNDPPPPRLQRTHRVAFQIPEVTQIHETTRGEQLTAPQDIPRAQTRRPQR